MSIRLGNKTIFLLVICAVFVTGVFSWMRATVPQQEPPRVRPQVPAGLPKTIGIIRHLKALDPVVNGFQQGMIDLGYIQGKNLVYDIKLAPEEKPETLSQIVKNYVQGEVDLIYAADTTVARAALEETEKTGKTYIPIVFAYAENPVEAGLVQSFLSSGNNTTGVAADITGLTEKKLGFLKALDPSIKKIGVFVAKYLNTSEKLLLAEIRFQTKKFGFQLVEYFLQNPPGQASYEELQEIARSIPLEEIDAYYHLPNSILNQTASLEVTGAMGKRLGIPTMYTSQDELWIAKGLLSYGYDLFSVGKQAASIADEILRGAHPKDVPLQSPQKNFLVINTKTAQESNIVIPNTLLDIVNKVTE